MGSSRWSDDFYFSRETDRKHTGKSAFEYDAEMRARPVEARRCHEKLNPYGVMRESRDSDVHPESLAIGVIFDETGSMGSIPITLQKKLSQLMGLLLRRGYVEHPQMLFGAVGDANYDVASLQIGQFESGIEMDDELARLYLEGGGGPFGQESYQNALYFFARHTAIDCYEKRRKQGYLFLIGDERPYMEVSAKEISTLIGDDLAQDIPLQHIIAEAREKYHVFFIIPSGASGGKDTGIARTWVSLLGQAYVLRLADPAAVCEAIALAIGMTEEKITLEEGLHHLEETGMSAHAARSVSTALAPYATSQALATRVEVAGLPEISGASSRLRTKRL